MAEPAPGGVPDTRLRALAELARETAVGEGARDVLVLGARAALQVLGASSASISQWERDTGVLRVLVNVGERHPGEEEEPREETYAVADFPRLLRLDEGYVGVIERLEDDRIGPEQRRLLQLAGKSSVLAVPIVLDGRIWGEIYATRRPDQPRFTDADIGLGGVVSAQVATGIARVDRLTRVSELAYTDTLTGLPNRRAIEERLDAAMDRHRAESVVVSLVVCDLNGLKHVNDELGHDVGDRMLERFAALLSTSAGLVSGSLAGRLGGDEFAILIEGHDSDAAVKVAMDLCLRAERMPDSHGVSCGVASTGDPVGHVETPARLFRLADAAQYRAKRSGARTPVVAGRGPARDMTAVALADAAPAATGDRRALRSRGRPLPAALLVAGIGDLDLLVGAGIRERLEAVANLAARHTDAASWAILRVPPGEEVLVVDSRAVHRLPVEASLGESARERRARDGRARADRDLPLAEYPQSARAAAGGAYVLEVGEPDADPAEEALLAGGGYTAKVAAGGPAEGQQWLVEICADELSANVHDLAPVLRALVAIALVGTQASRSIPA